MTDYYTTTPAKATTLAQIEEQETDEEEELDNRQGNDEGEEQTIEGSKK